MKDIRVGPHKLQQIPAQKEVLQHNLRRCKYRNLTSQYTLQAAVPSARIAVYQRDSEIRLQMCVVVGSTNRARKSRFPTYHKSKSSVVSALS